MSPDEFKLKLQQQLRFLKNSCSAYDLGDLEEALRLATTIRVLIHDTSNSTSLLTHMGQKTNIKLASTVRLPPPNLTPMGSQLSHVNVRVGGGQAAVPSHLPNLDKWGDVPRYEPVELWWTETVHHFPNLTRRGLVLTAANKDGGAHVDDGPLPPEYQQLVTGTWAFEHHDASGNIVVSRNAIPLENLAELRQIAYEVLNSPDLLALAD
jgi:hypothetical protein